MLEAQDWWTTPGEMVEGMSQHIHVSTCFPMDQTLSGTVPFDLHVQLHMNPGVLTKVSGYVFGNGVSLEQIAATPNYTCPTDQCDLWYHLDYDTTRVPVDGSLEFRFHAKVTSPDGTEGYTSTGWQATLANGGGRPVRAPYRTPPFIEARGWYTGTDYENARITSPLPSGPVSGLWTFNVNLAKGSGGTPVTNCLITLDPKFHAEPVQRGRVVFEHNGAYKGAVTIDTTTLSDGPHRLLLRTDSTIASGTGSGVLVVMFSVDNGGVAGAAMRLGSAVLETTRPMLPWIVILFFLALNFPWRSTVRKSAAKISGARGHAGAAIAPDAAIAPASSTQREARSDRGLTTSKDATWAAYQRAMSDPASRDGAEVAARTWVESIDRNERWG